MQVLCTWAKRIIIFLVAAFFFGLTALPSLQIILRLVGRPFIGAEELTRFFLICMVFLSYPLVVANRENIAMGELKALFPERIRNTLEVFIHSCSVLLTGFSAYAAWHTIARNLKGATPTLAIPFWVFLSCTFLAFLCSAVIHIGQLREALLQHKSLHMPKP